MKKEKNKTSVYRWILEAARPLYGRVILLTLTGMAISVLSVVFALKCRELIDTAVGLAGQVGTEEMTVAPFVSSAVTFALVIAAQLLLNMLYRFLHDTANGRSTMVFRTRFARACLTRKYADMWRWHSGEMMNRMTSDVNVVNDGVIGIIPDVASFATQLVCAAGVILKLDYVFALIFLVGSIAVFFAARLLRSCLKRYHRQMQEAEGRVHSYFQEIFSSLLTVKVFRAEDRAVTYGDELQEEKYHLLKRRAAVSAVTNLGFATIMRVGYAFALIWCGYKLMYGLITFGTLTAIQQLVGRIQAPVSGLSGLISRLASLEGSAERLREPEQLEEEPRVEQGLDYETFRGLSVKNLSFAYDKRDVLKDLSFDLERGDFAAVTGLSGSGKSTFFKLLLGVYDSYRGDILIRTDEGDRRPDSGTRSLFAYVPQGNILFSGTIRNNVTFIRPDATEEEIREALRLSCADEFIDNLPNGLDTEITEGGGGLSEGQRQRLNVARALLSGASFLLFDEATSALDEATETKLLANLRAMKDKTLLIVTHRRAALTICNREIIIP